MITKLIIDDTALYNTTKLKFQFLNNCVTVTSYAIAEDSEEYAEDSMYNVELANYTAYVIVKRPKKYRSYFINPQTSKRYSAESDLIILNLNKLSYGSRYTNTMIDDIYIKGLGTPICQFNTKLVDYPTVLDIMIQPINIKNDNIEIVEDPVITIEEIVAKSVDGTGIMSSQKSKYWDAYAIEIDGKQVTAGDRAVVVGDSMPPIDMSERDYITINIKKYDGTFTTPLTRDIDCEEVALECTCGLLNTTRVNLINGVGSVRLYNFGYLGKFSLKVGTRWFPAWDQYKLQFC